MEENHRQPIFVVGATGLQGGAIIKALLQRKHKYQVFGLTRNPESEKSKKLKEQGVVLIKGNLDDVALLEKQMKSFNIFGVFLMTMFLEKGIPSEIEFGKNVATAAKNAGVKHLIFSSIGQANNNSGVPHFDSKFEIEKFIKTLGINFTILRPVAFFENFEIYIPPKNGSLSIPLAPDIKVILQPMILVK